MTRSKKGFTLIELLIVVVIIGILAAIAIPKFANTKEKAYVASMKADLRNLATYEESFAADSAGVYFSGNGSTQGGPFGIACSPCLLPLCAVVISQRVPLYTGDSLSAVHHGSGIGLRRRKIDWARSSSCGRHPQALTHQNLADRRPKECSGWQAEPN